MLTIFAAACIDLQKRDKIDSCICQAQIKIYQNIAKMATYSISSNINVVGQSEPAESAPFLSRKIKGKLCSTIKEPIKRKIHFSKIILFFIVSESSWTLHCPHQLLFHIWTGVT